MPATPTSLPPQTDDHVVKSDLSRHKAGLGAAPLHPSKAPSCHLPCVGRQDPALPGPLHRTVLTDSPLSRPVLALLAPQGPRLCACPGPSRLSEEATTPGSFLALVPVRSRCFPCFRTTCTALHSPGIGRVRFRSVFCSQLRAPGGQGLAIELHHSPCPFAWLTLRGSFPVNGASDEVMPLSEVTPASSKCRNGPASVAQWLSFKP